MSGNLQAFTVSDLGRFTPEGAGSIPDDADHWLFYVGRDDVHGVLAYLLGLVTKSLYLNMFGYDDDALNKQLMSLAENADVTALITLDKSQAGGVHEKLILASDVASNPAAFKTSFAIGQSATHQITHTKGGVLDDIVGFEGSTNWSSSGEGTFVTAGAGKPGGPGYKAQNNTLMVFADKPTCDAFRAELVHEHQVVLAQGGAIASGSAPPA